MGYFFEGALKFGVYEVMKFVEAGPVAAALSPTARFLLAGCVSGFAGSAGALSG